MELQDRVAVVTGAAQGIGKAAALTLAEAGAGVVLLDRPGAAARAAAEDIQRSTGRQTMAVAADVTDKRQVERAVAAAVKAFGRIDVLVNSAGVWGHGHLCDVTECEWDRIFAVNLKGVLSVLQAVVRGMKDRRSGKVVNIASAAGLSPMSDWSAYCISKAAVVMLTAVAAKELEPVGVQVNVLCPGAVDTNMSRCITEQTGDAFPHAMPPAKVAAAVLKLVSPYDQTTTGAVVIDF